MRTNFIHPHPDARAAPARHVVLACSALLVLACGAATAATRNKDTGEARTRYLADRAACVEGRTHQDRATCLREAAAALEEARRGKLAERGADFDRNRFLRCEPLPPADKQDCMRRMNGEGTVRGSVEQGGIYRELRTTIPAPAAGASPAQQ